LTLASLAASAPGRELPYSIITRRLHIPSEEVELWVIDVIRAGLVEGKLSQLNQTFLIHRSTYRSFGTSEWEEIGVRLESWKQSLRNILEVVKSAREQASTQGGDGAVQIVNGGGNALQVEG
jgi:translation initiation factor 3 subunit M